jgi:predicted nucleic acid-binding OB-fold protein
MREVNEAVDAYLSMSETDGNRFDLLDLVEKSVPSVEKKFWELVDEARRIAKEIDALDI